jgi:hypothetical protein
MTARSLIAGLILALTAISCSDKSPTEINDSRETQPTSPVVAPVTGAPLVIQNVVGRLDGGGVFQGTLTITSFARDAAGNLLASGTLTGVARQGATVTQIAQTFANVPVSLLQQGRTCQILHLDLGPLHLDLLGLNVDLSRVVLDITAVAGPGNLLGNLLCALAGLLDQSPLDLLGIDALLAQINAILAGA